MSVSAFFEKFALQTGFWGFNNSFVPVTDKLICPWGFGAVNSQHISPVGASDVDEALNHTMRNNFDAIRMEVDLNWNDLSASDYAKIYAIYEASLHYQKKPIVERAVSATGTNTITLSSTLITGLLSGTNDDYNGCFVQFVASSVTYVRKITDWDGAGRVLTYAGANVASIAGNAVILQPRTFQSVLRVWIDSAENSDTLICVHRAPAEIKYNVSGGGIYTSPGGMKLVERTARKTLPAFLKK